MQTAPAPIATCVRPRKLLVTRALATAGVATLSGLLGGCSDPPLAGNPKGSWHERPPDAGAAQPRLEQADGGTSPSPPASSDPLSEPEPAASATAAPRPGGEPSARRPQPPPSAVPLPANPKGSAYDAGLPIHMQF